MTQPQATTSIYSLFHAARQWLESNGSQVRRSEHSAAEYWVTTGNLSLICSRSDVIDIAKHRGWKHD